LGNSERKYFLKAESNWLHHSVKLFIISSALYFFSFLSADPDLWGHLKFGEALWQTKALESHNLYSFTAPNHPWINHEWLSEFIFYGAYHFFGGVGLLCLKLVIGLAIVWLLFRISLYRPFQVIFLAIGFALVVSVVSPGFMVRPQVFSYLWFTAFFYVFHCYFERNQNRLWLLPGIMILWCNSHGGFLIGWGQFTIILVWQGLIYIFKDRQTGKSLSVLFFWYFLTTAACFVTPYGYKLLVFLYHSLFEPRPIGEWNPIRIWDTAFLRFKVLAALFVVSLAYPSGGKKNWETAVIVVTLVFAFKHQRHTPFFAIMVGPFLIEWVTLLCAKLNMDVDGFVSGRATRSILSAFLVLLCGYQISHTSYRYMKAGFHIIADPLFYPVQAVQFMKTNQIEGNLLLPFEWGEYAIWKLYPHCRVSIDGRFRTAYPENVLNDHIFPLHDDAAWSRLITKYPADIILSGQIPFFWNLIKTSKEWVYVYSDRSAILFLRNNEQNLGLLRNFKDGKLMYPDEPVSIYFP
jgi:hypothetical protein